MTMAIAFDPRWAAWSAFTFWTVLISIVLTLGFTLAILIGGISDLRFLISSLGESTVAADLENSAARTSSDDHLQVDSKPPILE